MAGGGVKGGVVHGETDEFSYNIIRDPVHIREFQLRSRTCSASTTSGSPKTSRAFRPS